MLGPRGEPDLVEARARDTRLCLLGQRGSRSQHETAEHGKSAFWSPPLRDEGVGEQGQIWSFPRGIATLSLPTRSRAGVQGLIELSGVRPDEEVEAVPDDVAKGLNSEVLRVEEHILKQGGKK